MRCPRRCLTVAVALGALLSSCARPPVAPPLSVPAVSVSFPRPPEPAAQALWERSRQAARNTPLSAQAVILRWNPDGKLAGRSRLTVLEGTGGQFRLTYEQPPGARGRIVVCDGRTTWQYEPRTQTILRRPPLADLPQEPPSARSALWRPEIAPGPETVAGRTTRILVLRDGAGRIVERRWVDEESGRSLRTDVYDDRAQLARRVALSAIVVRPAVAPDAFRPNFPVPARTLLARAVSARDAPRAAHGLGLPARARGFRLRSVVRPTPRRADGETHVLYSDGTRVLSVFVTPGAGDHLAAMPSAGSWYSTSLGETQRGYVQSAGGGRSAVAWVQGHRRYVAVARLPVSDLLAVARALSDFP